MYSAPDDEQSTCSKHVEFRPENKFEKFVRIVDFIMRIYNDTLTSERQIFSVTFSDMFSLRSRQMKLCDGTRCPRDRHRNWFGTVKLTKHFQTHFSISALFLPSLWGTEMSHRRNFKQPL